MPGPDTAVQSLTRRKPASINRHQSIGDGNVSKGADDQYASKDADAPIHPAVSASLLQSHIALHSAKGSRPASSGENSFSLKLASCSRFDRDFRTWGGYA